MSNNEMLRCWAEIDLGAIRHNARVALAHAGPGARVLAVVKADGYGHGAGPVARALAADGLVRDFGVANVAEAAALRAVLPDAASIELLSPALPAEHAEVARLEVTPWLSTPEETRAYAAVAAGRSAPLPVVIEADTGMGRSGVLPEGLAAVIVAVMESPALRLAGIATHLPSSDEDDDFTRAQLAGWETLKQGIGDRGLKIDFQSRNSAGLLGFPPAPGGGEIVRAGLMIYGASPRPESQALLRPALAWKTRVTLVRELPAGHGVSYGRTFRTPRPMRVATVAAGYADGYPRILAGRDTAVLVRGRRAPLLGRVTMDQMMFDADAFPDLAPGEEVVLLGRQGAEEIPAGELALKAGTIAWEIFTGISPRGGRLHLPAG